MQATLQDEKLHGIWYSNTEWSKSNFEFETHSHFHYHSRVYKNLMISGTSIFRVRHYSKIAKFKLQENFLTVGYIQQQQIAWKSFLTSSIAA